MTLSMTAFARNDQETPWGSLIWELRSVNHRYLEVSLRLPEDLRALETPVRDLIGKRLGRGKVDGILRFQARDAITGEFAQDETLVTRLISVARKTGEIGTQHGVALSPLRVIDLLRWPGVLKTTGVDMDALMAAAMTLLDQALDEMRETRRREGERLADTISQRVDGMEAITATVRAVLPEVLQSFRQRLDTRLAEVRKDLDPARVEQEVVLFAQKIDVDEELDRLSAHIAEVRRVLKQGGQIGRRLDFLMQELNREANTLGSKAADLRLTNAAVDLKVLIEQMREQVQNIE
ncbi:MAG: YicC family protein [Candidatus Muproteobacteria bacterium RBG_19FT_COMBO_61_10]|uniref:YicC family protein n=1 Tax=Candidatus Muproteobacteria bacterium RBG_19FT_COMBO_61_10 TaxID=1817761 RepID=A0A1F6UNQ0_9PROT|nr:MAG: YicC family protein [Candidatus Muproteobacteria bacterium RBG_19FT_COMBO_61_10]